VPLSFEHVPPKRAFNNGRQVVVSGVRALEIQPGVPPKGRVVQGGVGDHTLCEDCNNNTGSWYAPALISWAHQVRDVLVAASGRPTLPVPYQLFPLRVLKQVVAMFFSINSDALRRHHPQLARFVRDREAHPLPRPFRAFAYMTAGEAGRAVGFAQLRRGPARWRISELTSPPFGFVLMLDGPGPLHAEMEEITRFDQYDIDQHDMIFLRLPLLPIESALPGVYLTKEELIARKLTHRQVLIDGKPSSIGEAYLGEAGETMAPWEESTTKPHRPGTT
jgi:hypothetical protein